MDPEKRNYRLDISHSPFPNMYPVFHISELEPYHNLPRSLVPEPHEDERIINILNSRKRSGRYQYLVTYLDSRQEWVDADVIDKNPHYDGLLKDYQEYSYHQFLANVDNHSMVTP